jgi:hypothetical protein
MADDTKYQDEMESIGKLLDIALEYGLEVETIYYALEKMKENPNLSPLEAFSLGVIEFVK